MEQQTMYFEIIIISRRIHKTFEFPNNNKQVTGKLMMRGTNEMPHGTG